MPKKEKGKGIVREKGGFVPPFSAYAVEIRAGIAGKKNVLICACDEILSYTHELIKFAHADEWIVITGAGLFCRTYADHTAEVTGYVKAVSFIEVDHDQ